MTKYAAKNIAKRQIANGTWFSLLIVILVYSVVVTFSMTIPLIGLVFPYIFSIGLVNVFLILYKKQTVDFSALFDKSVFDGFLNKVVLFLLKLLYLFIGFLLLYIPGIIMSYEYALAEFIALENPDYTASECLRESKDKMRGLKWDLFMFDLSFIWWFLLCCIFPFAALWVMPYYYHARTIFLYENGINEKTYKGFLKRDNRNKGSDDFTSSDYDTINLAESKFSNRNNSSYNYDEENKG